MKKEVEGGSNQILQGPGFAACFKGKTSAVARSILFLREWLLSIKIPYSKTDTIFDEICYPCLGS